MKKASGVRARTCAGPPPTPNLFRCNLLNFPEGPYQNGGVESNSKSDPCNMYDMASDNHYTVTSGTS